MEQGGDEEEPEPAMNGAEDDDGADFLLKDDTNDIDLRCDCPVFAGLVTCLEILG